MSRLQLKAWIADHEVVKGEVANATACFKGLHDALVEEIIFWFLYLLLMIRLCSLYMGFALPRQVDRIGKLDDCSPGVYVRRH